MINSIVCGDCLKIMGRIGDNSIDMIVCDLPYGTTANQWDVVIPFDEMWRQYNRIVKNGAPILLFGTGLFAARLAVSNEKQYKYDIIWHKSKSGSGFTAKYRPVAKHESILVFGNGKITYNPQLLPGAPYRRNNDSRKVNNMQYGIGATERINDGTRHPSTIQFFQQRWRRQDQLHPTQKPVELLEWLVKSYSNVNDVILDNCIGSGTTAVACKNTGRNFIGIDISEEYCNIARERINGTTIQAPS